MKPVVHLLGRLTSISTILLQAQGLSGPPDWRLWAGMPPADLLAVPVRQYSTRAPCFSALVAANSGVCFADGSVPACGHWLTPGAVGGGQGRAPVIRRHAYCVHSTRLARPARLIKGSETAKLSALPSTPR